MNAFTEKKQIKTACAIGAGLDWSEGSGGVVVKEKCDAKLLLFKSELALKYKDDSHLSSLTL